MWSLECMYPISYLAVVRGGVRDELVKIKLEGFLPPPAGTEGSGGQTGLPRPLAE